MLKRLKRAVLVPRERHIGEPVDRTKEPMDRADFLVWLDSYIGERHIGEPTAEPLEKVQKASEAELAALERLKGVASKKKKQTGSKNN
jgi:hypothetical protein